MYSAVRAAETSVRRRRRGAPAAAELCGAGGERRAATDASPQAASPQLNSRSGGRLEGGLGRLGGGTEVVKSRSACTHTESNDGNESIDLNGFDLLKTSINVGQRLMDNCDGH